MPRMALLSMLCYNPGEDTCPQVSQSPPPCTGTYIATVGVVQLTRQQTLIRLPCCFILPTVPWS